MSDENLKPCPFCGGNDVEMSEHNMVWSGHSWSEPSCVSIVHHCQKNPSLPSVEIKIIGSNRLVAIAAWSMRTPLAATAPQEQELSNAKYLDILNAEGVR